MISTPLSRRAVLAGAATLVVTRDAGAQALRPGAHQSLIDSLTGGRRPVAGRLRLQLPEIVENGNTVPLTVAADAPMSGGTFVKAIHVVADSNPNPEVFSAFFSPLSGKAEVSTRIRLAASMNVIALAELADGTWWSATAAARVTIGGCGAG